MPVFLNWLLRLIPTNPICMRLVQGGSRRARHLYIRSGYLAVMIVVLLFAMLGNSTGSLSVRELATAGANTFTLISYLQVALICLLAPVFMAGAIAQEANPRTWDILLTTPLNSLQVVLGNMFGRLFFILALLFSTLPLFAVTQFFGGVPGESIFASYAIAGTSSLLVAAIAITLSVTRTAGRRAVFLFYICVVLYLFITYAIDLRLRAIPPGNQTTVMTPLNPFLSLEVLLSSNTYAPHNLAGEDAGWLTQLWLTRPIAAFCWVCAGLSTVLIAFSTLRLRVIGSRAGGVPWYRRVLGLGARGASERPARRVSHNPVAWRESVARGNTLGAIVGRWGFVVVGVIIAIGFVLAFHLGAMSGSDLRLAVAATVGAEIVIIALVALNMSATAVSREREDGSLDIILTTPIQPGPYLAGKLRGLIQYLIPMMLVPTLTMAIIACYTMVMLATNSAKVTMKDSLRGATSTIDLPVVLPEGALALPVLLVPFVAFCVIVGLHWSIRSKGTIGSVISAVGVVAAVAGVLSLCGFAGGSNMPIIGAVFSGFSPINLLASLIYPADFIARSLDSQLAGRLSLLIGATFAGAVYAVLVVVMHTNIKRTFMMTVRRLAGTN
jgi:ABC-type transport system involved in multi-copper enzyme maturation permease subunit